RLVLSPQGAHDRNRFVGEGAALGVGASHRADLFLDEPDAHAHDQAAATEDVERRRRLREPDGVVVRKHEHRGAQAHPPRPRRDEGQERQRLVVRLAADPVEDVAHVEDVIVDPDRVDADFLGPAREIDERLRVGDAPVVEERESNLHRAEISSPHGSIAGRSGVNSLTRPAAPARIVSILARSAGVRSISVPASFASTSAGVRAPTSAVLSAGLPSTHASAIWLSGTPRGSATSRRRRSTTPTLVFRFSPRKIGWPKATPPPRQSRDGSPKFVAVVKAPVRRPWASDP